MPCSILLRACKTALLILILFAGARSAWAGDGTVWPGNVHVIEASLLKPKPPAEGQTSFELSLPQLRAYDPQGRRLAEMTGFDIEGFGPAVTRLLDGKETPDASKPFADELTRISAPEEKPLPALPEADITIVKYWAEWCVPCHAQSRELARALAEHPNLHVNLVHVDADLSRYNPKGSSAPRKIELDPETVKKLEDPNLTQEQRSTLLREAIKAAMEKQKAEEKKPEETPAPPPR